MKPLKILIVDDHALFSSGAAELIQNHFNAEVDQMSDPTKVLQTLDATYDVILTDIDMPQMNGIDLIRKIKQEKPDQKIMVVSMHNKQSIVSKCKSLGVEGYVVKFDDNETFLEAIEGVYEGESYYSLEVQEMMEELNETGIILTPREEQVIKMVCLGHRVSEIAAALFISTETVKSHYKNIRTKLGVKSKSEIIQYGRDNLII